MTALLEADRVQVRKYLGFADLFLQADPRLESAMSAIQATADGGTRPTSDAQLAMLGIVYGWTTKNGRSVRGLQDVDADISQLSAQQGAIKADEVTGDSARETLRLQMEGRMLVARLARMLDTYPRSDCFAQAPMLEDAYPNYPRTARQAY